MAEMYADFNDNGAMEENDDDIGALRSILSWDEEDEQDGGEEDDEGMNKSSERENGSIPPDMVQFSMKDGEPQFSFLQFQGGSSNNGDTGSTGRGAEGSKLTLSLPMPTPIANFEHSNGNSNPGLNNTPSAVAANKPAPGQGAQAQQQQGIAAANFAQLLAQHVGAQLQSSGAPAQQQQQVPAAAAQQTQAQYATNPAQAQQQTTIKADGGANAQNALASQQFASVQAQQGLAANFAQFLAQQAQQAAANTQQQQQQQQTNSQNAGTSVQQTQKSAAPQVEQTQVQQPQMQMPFTADPNAFLQQLQFAQLQQQLQAAQRQAAAAPVPMQANQLQQLQASFAQQGSSSMQMPVARPTASQPPPAKKAKIGPSTKKSITKAMPKTTKHKVASNTPIAMGVVSASDTEGETSRSLATTTSGPISKQSNVDSMDLSHLSGEEKAKANRDRNREHARNTRLRKKAYLEKLKTTVDDLCRERDTLVSERAGAAHLLVEMHSTRTEVLMSFFALRSANEKRRELWSSLLDESSFTCSLPVTPYRSFASSEVQVSKCQRTVLGVDAIMADTASVHVLFDSLVDRSKFPKGKIEFQYTLVTEEAVVAGNQMMARWIMSTTNATKMGARMEVSKQGMLCCKFNSSHRIVGLEFMFDVMAFMLQVKQAAGSDGFSVVPNTVQTCQKSFDKPMSMTLAEPPYTIVQVNKLWEDMTGYKAEEVVGKSSTAILEKSNDDRKASKTIMEEIRYKRATSGLLCNAKKTGEPFQHHVVMFPLSNDSRISHYLTLSTVLDPVDRQTSTPPSEVQAPRHQLNTTATASVQAEITQKVSPLVPPMLVPGFPRNGGQVPLLPAAPVSNSAATLKMPPPASTNITMSDHTSKS